MKRRMRLTFSLIMIISVLLCSGSFSRMTSADPIFYAEQWYQLYAKSMSDVTTNINRNIVYLQQALKAPFSPVVQALCVITTQEQYIRYKYLFKMHVNFLIMRSYIQLGDRYNKENIYFYNYLYKDMILESLKVAKTYYETALIYWREAISEAQQARTFQKYPIALDAWEDEYGAILGGRYDYEKLLDKRLEDLLANIAYIENWANQFYPQQSTASPSG